MLWDLFKEYLFLNLGDYFEGIDFPITIFLLSISVGICIACVLVAIHRTALARLIKALLRHEANSPESAKTLAELRIKPNFFTRGALSRRGILFHMVGMVGGFPHEREAEEGKKAEKIDFSTARFFIKPEGADRAVATAERGAPTVINTALGCILILMVFITLSLFVPGILRFFTGR